MFAMKEIKKQTKGFAPLDKKHNSQDRAEGTKQPDNLSGPVQFLQRCMGNSYMQSMAASDSSFTSMWQGPLQE